MKFCLDKGHRFSVFLNGKYSGVPYYYFPMMPVLKNFSFITIVITLFADEGLSDSMDVVFYDVDRTFVKRIDRENLL